MPKGTSHSSAARSSTRTCTKRNPEQSMTTYGHSIHKAVVNVCMEILRLQDESTISSTPRGRLTPLRIPRLCQILQRRHYRRHPHGRLHHQRHRCLERTRYSRPRHPPRLRILEPDTTKRPSPRRLQIRKHPLSTPQSRRLMARRRDQIRRYPNHSFRCHILPSTM